MIALEKLSETIFLLSENRGDIDLDNLVSTLKSINADAAAEHQSLVREVSEKLAEAEKTIEAQKKDLDTLLPIVEDTRKKLSGKVSLLFTDSNRKNDILAKIISPDTAINELVLLKNEIEYQFEQNWTSNNQPAKNFSTKITPDNYKSGAKNNGFTSK